jgi:hypothetical protein
MALRTDYLIVGSGAMGMAFADTLLTETDATLAIIDRHHQPGGHWNDAYPFVRLHQPSAFYGVNSRPLGSDTIDASGWNKGLYELATNGEVCAYFDQVMQQQFLPSGRVQYFPMCDYLGDGAFESRVSGVRHDVNAATLVDATYMNVTVPSVTPPKYNVDVGVRCVPPNDLPRLASKALDYVVVGAGKTGMDACLWLLRHETDPARIHWIMPRDSWLLDRANIQPGALSGQTVRAFALQNHAIANSNSVAEMFAALHESGQLLRLDNAVEPTMYRCATVTTAELEQLRRIENIVRLGHVRRIGTNTIELDGGAVGTTRETLHIDCTADGLERRPAVPVFGQDTITLQSVRTCQQVFSAALIGYVEANYASIEEKNRLCGVVPHPDSHLDFLRTALTNGQNQFAWTQDGKLQAWLQNARLDGFSGAAAALTAANSDLPFSLPEMQQNLFGAIAKLQGFVTALDGH